MDKDKDNAKNKMFQDALVNEKDNTEEEGPSTAHITSASKTIMNSLKDHMIEISAKNMDT